MGWQVAKNRHSAVVKNSCRSCGFEVDSKLIHLLLIFRARKKLAFMVSSVLSAKLCIGVSKVGIFSIKNSFVKFCLQSFLIAKSSSGTRALPKVM